MRKILSLLLSTCLIFGACPVYVMASEVHTKYLKISVDGNTQTYECLWDNKEIYCSVENLAEMSKYDWAQIEDDLEFNFFREYESDAGDYGIELQTGVSVKVDDNKKTAEIEAMNESYSMDCYIEDGNVFLPLEKLLYLLHAEWTIEDDIVCVKSMPLTILDFMAIYSNELAQIASTSEDALINTGWLFSDNKWGQAVYSTVAEVFNDFDGKIFMLWWPGEGHVETAECYENAILQLAKEDKEFIGEKVQADAMENVVNSIFSLNNEYSNKIQNIISVPENVDGIVQSIPDAVSLLEQAGTENKKLKNIADQIENGEIDSSFLEIPELESKAKQLGEIGDGLAILQCVWNAYDTASRVNSWNDEYLKQLQVLADYENPEYVNENITGYVRSSAQRLIDSYNDPTKAVANEALQSVIGLLLSKTFDESPFGKVFSIMGAVGACYGTFDIKMAETYDVYSELSVVTFSIKVEQLVRELFKYEDILTTTDKLTNECIEEARNQLMIYLRLNLRNKAQLYNLNVRGNKDKNWVNSEDAKELYNEMVKVYAMIAELIETKDYDYRIILGDDLENIHSVNATDILLDEKPLSFNNIFVSFPQNFTFTSGIGAWDTQISINEDGTFFGSHGDSNPDEIYISNFTGSFSDLEKIDEYTYKLQLKSIELENTPGEIYYKDNIKYIYSDPYGLEYGKDFILYLPGRDTKDLPDEFLGWVKIAGDVSERLPFYGLYNVNGKYGFFSDIILGTKPNNNLSEENPIEVSDNIEISSYLEQHEQLVELLGMKPTEEYWQFPDSKSYVVDQFYLEWDSNSDVFQAFSMKNMGTSYIKLYGSSIGDNILKVEISLSENGWVNHYSTDEYIEYIAILNDKEYLLHVYVDEDNNMTGWYLKNWPEGEWVAEDFEKLRNSLSKGEFIEVSEYLDSNPEELIELFDMQINTPWQFGDAAESYHYDDFAVEWKKSTDYTMTSAGLGLNTEADDGRIYNVSLYGIILGMTGEEVKNKLTSNGYIPVGSDNYPSRDFYAKNENGKRYGIYMQFYENQLSSWYWCNWREGEDLPDIDPYTYETYG